MSKRAEMPQNRDQRVFKRTAVKTKRINIQPKASRGGTRL